MTALIAITWCIGFLLYLALGLVWAFIVFVASALIEAAWEWWVNRKGRAV